MTRIQVGQGTARPARPRGNGGGIVGNSPAALSCLLAVLAQAAPERRLAFVAAVGPRRGESETLAIRRARTGECGLSAREIRNAYTVVCNGTPTLVDDLPGMCDLLSRVTLLASARWSLVDGVDGAEWQGSGAAEVYDGA